MVHRQNFEWYINNLFLVKLCEDYWLGHVAQERVARKWINDQTIYLLKQGVPSKVTTVD